MPPLLKHCQTMPPLKLPSCTTKQKTAPYLLMFVHWFLIAAVLNMFGNLFVEETKNVDRKYQKLMPMRIRFPKHMFKILNVLSALRNIAIQKNKKTPLQSPTLPPPLERIETYDKNCIFFQRPSRDTLHLSTKAAHWAAHWAHPASRVRVQSKQEIDKCGRAHTTNSQINPKPQRAGGTKAVRQQGPPTRCSLRLSQEHSSQA